MRRTVQVIERPLITSERCPEIFTNREDFAEAFAWADDECPVAWKIVTENKSKAFGKNASCYVGSSHGTDPESVAMRLAVFHDFVTGSDRKGETLWNWAARFTVENYGGKKRDAITGGLFQQHAVHTHDGLTKEYPRNCTTLDYTPALLSEVLDQFQKWFEARNERGELSGYPNTTRITIDGKTVRTFAPNEV